MRRRCAPPPRHRRRRAARARRSGRAASASRRSPPPPPPNSLPQLAPAAARFARLAPRASAASAAAPAAGLKLATAGTPETLEYRIWQQGAGGATVSAWHDIPLYAGSPGLLNFVCEIPAETSAKMELSTKEAGNPIKQDVKKGAVRFYPYNINWNYGMLPQTWEDPAHKNAECFGAGVGAGLLGWGWDSCMCALAARARARHARAPMRSTPHTAFAERLR